MELRLPAWLRRLVDALRRNPPAPLPEGHWVTGTQTSPYGPRFYRLWVPRGYDGRNARPMLVMLHGCQQNADDFARGTAMNSLADEHNFFVLYPEQGQAYNVLDCWDWSSPENQQRGIGEPSVIADTIAWARKHYRVDGEAMAVAGISAGAAMANTMAVTYPELFRGVACVAGVMYAAAGNNLDGIATMLSGSARDPEQVGREMSARMGARRHPMKVLVFQGTADKVVNPKNADQIIASWAAADDASRSPNQEHIQSVPAVTKPGVACRPYTRSDYLDAAGVLWLQKYLIEGLEHAWPGGDKDGSYTDPCGPPASQIIVEWFGLA